MARVRSSSSADPGIEDIRQKEIRLLLLHRYGPVLPDDDAGRDDLQVMLRHLAHLRRGSQRMVNFCDLSAPWLRDRERELFLQQAARSRPPRFTADQLAKRLNVILVVRKALALTTIGAVDFLKPEREHRRRKLARERQAKHREKLGHKPRAEYLSATLSKGAQPWVAEGISRTTWYRRQRVKLSLGTVRSQQPLRALS